MTSALLWPAALAEAQTRIKSQDINAFALPGGFVPASKACLAQTGLGIPGSILGGTVSPPPTPSRESNAKR